MSGRRLTIGLLRYKLNALLTQCTRRRLAGGEPQAWRVASGFVQSPPEAPAELGTTRPCAIAGGRAAGCASNVRQRCISTRFLSRRDCSNAFVLASAQSNVASLLVEAAWDSTGGHLWTASRPEQAATTVEHARKEKQCRLSIVDQPACRRENLARWADVNVTLLVEREVFPTNVPSSRFDWSITGTCGAIFFSLTSQLRFAPEP